ncbi:MAG TPA: L,D-transpeptidase [Actinomycetota bacterium]|nr:L,D-transpeptidase [Actinomycetota bacterium]
MRRLPPGPGLHLAWLGTVLGVVLALSPALAAVAERSAPTDSLVAIVRADAPIHAGPVFPQARDAVKDRAHLGAKRAPTRPTIAPELGTHLLVHVPGAGLAAHRYPTDASPVVGTVVGSSRYYHVPLVVWVEGFSADRGWGKVQLPYAWPRREGWIRLDGLRREWTSITVTVDLSAHRVSVFRDGRRLLAVAGAIGSGSSPTPPGDYVVTDRVPFWPGSALGSFAFGISGIQPRLPAGWSGGDQLAIHGTNDPSSIGESVSAGCVRVSEWTLHRLEPLLRLGTPVLIRP